MEWKKIFEEVMVINVLKLYLIILQLNNCLELKI